MKLTTENLCRVYRNGETSLTALSPCSLAFNSGEQAAIVGASGSGKTTLLHLLGGLDHPTSGRVLYDGEDLYQKKESERAVFRRRNIGFVFQSYNLVPELTAEENIMLPWFLDHKKGDRKLLQSVAETLEINDRLTHLPGQLSGGQQQRVAIARAVIRTPAVLLCDEPTGNLDTVSSKEVIRLLRSLSAEHHIMLLVVTHDTRISSEFPRVITICDGKAGGDLL